MAETNRTSSATGSEALLRLAEQLERDLGGYSRSPAEALEPLGPVESAEPDSGGRRMHPVLAFFNAMLQLAFVTAVIGLALFYFGRQQFDQPGPLPNTASIIIPKGEGVSAIADRLEQDKVIVDRGLFVGSVVYFTYLRGAGSLKAGEYEFPKHASLRQVLDTLVDGKSVEHKITFPEGLTSQQIVQKLLAHPDLQGTIAEIPAEGSLLPDTYRFQRGDSRLQIVERMKSDQKKFLDKLWNERDPEIPVQTPEEALILASIVEKETGQTSERPHVASVFQNRLRKRMRLQSDPTIIYGLVGGKGFLDHPIQQEELDRETPYNTYKIDGLPPTPIANPGRASIEAVLKPAKTNDLYFVADGTGGHVFAPSLNEHNRNVARWRKVERELRAQERAAAAAAAANSPAPVSEGAPGTQAPAGEEAAVAGAPDTGAIDLLGETGVLPAEPGEVPLPPRHPAR
jgi:UPF0755 protein